MPRPEFGRRCRYCTDGTCAACRAAIVATPHQEGATYDPTRDHARLSVQHAAVWRLVRDGSWWTLEDLTRAAGYPPGSIPAISARLRDFHKPRYGGHTIEKEHVGGGLWRYRLVVEVEKVAA
jgi:hypothetical protein